MTFSIIKIKDRLAKKRMDKSRYFQQYCTMMFALLVLILIGGLIEAYITPVFMELVVNII